MNLIEFKNVSLEIENKKILDDFSLTIKKGDKILISGKSGTGKSTLIKCLLGFQSFSEGFISFENNVLGLHDFKHRREFYAYVNQDVTMRKGKIKENLKIFEDYKHNTLKLDEHILNKELMDYFEFNKDLLNKNTEELSGGERQRLGLITSIMLKRPVFLLDEVTSALDSELKEKVANYFANCDETVIAISHDEVWEKTNLFRKVVL